MKGNLILSLSVYGRDRGEPARAVARVDPDGLSGMMSPWPVPDLLYRATMCAPRHAN